MLKHATEEQMALYAAGDLAPNESASIAAHLENCEQCQSACQEFARCQQFMAAALLDPELDDLLQVRERTLASLKPSVADRKRWAWGLAAAALAALALLLPAVHRGQRTTTLRKPELIMAQRAAHPKPPAALVVPAPRPVLARAKRLRHTEAGIRAVTLIAGANQRATLKMITRDPSVVILWQMNERAEEQ